VRCSFEALHLNETYAWPPLNWTVKARDADRYHFLDLLFSAPTEPIPYPPRKPLSRHFKRVLATGFKVFTKQLFLPELQGIAASPSIRKVVLRRKNLVDMYISEQKAQAVGEYANTDTSDIVLTVNTRAMLWFFEAVEADSACIDAARNRSTDRFRGADWHSIDYDELTNPETRQDALQGVLNHILPPSYRIPVVSISRGHQKQDRSGRNASIANFAEVYDALKKTPRYLDMLMEGL
jgi:hypothetical protein